MKFAHALVAYIALLQCLNGVLDAIELISRCKAIIKDLQRLRYQMFAYYVRNNAPQIITSLKCFAFLKSKSTLYNVRSSKMEISFS